MGKGTSKPIFSTPLSNEESSSISLNLLNFLVASTAISLSENQNHGTSESSNSDLLVRILAATLYITMVVLEGGGPWESPPASPQRPFQKRGRSRVGAESGPCLTPL